MKRMYILFSDPHTGSKEEYILTNQNPKKMNSDFEDYVSLTSKSTLADLHVLELPEAMNKKIMEHFFWDWSKHDNNLEVTLWTK